MKNRLPTPLQRLLTIFLFCFALGSLVQAGTIGPLTYQVNGDTVTITDCDTTVTGTIIVPATIEGKPVTTIGDNALRYCLLSDITLPSSVTSIGSSAFRDCSSLTNMIIPASVTSIGILAFRDCSSLSAIHVEDGNLSYTSDDGILFNAAQTQLIQYPAGKPDVSYTIPASVTSIGSSAFSRCSSLINITIPSSVTSINDWAFGHCISLTNLTIPSSVTSIEIAAFYSCSSLTNLTIPVGVTSIGNLAFYDCSSLTNITIPAGVTSIGSSAFFNCISLTNITIPVGVTSIGSSAFFSCSSLTNITLSASVTSIGSSAFHSCSSLSAIHVEDGNLSYTSDDGILFNAALTQLIKYPSGKLGNSYTIPTSVTSIERSAFYSCSSLTNIAIPAGVTSIGSYAFRDCNSLSAIHVEEGNPSYTSGAGVLFNAGQTQLIAYPVGKPETTYSIPDSVTSIDRYVLLGCGNLSSIEVEEGNLHYTSMDGVLLNADQTKLVAYPGGKPGTYSIPESIVNIPPSAFLNSSSLTGIIIPKEVTVEYNAFRDCDSLMNITVEDGHPNYTSIDGVLFSADQTKLIIYPEGRAGPYSIPDGISLLGSHAFYGCSPLTEVTIPDSVSKIDRWAFEGCGSLTDIILPSSVTTLGYGVFYQCSSLGSIILPSSVESIDYKVFWDCSALETATFLGDAPASFGIDVFLRTAENFSIRYLSGSSGFTSPIWMGYPSYEIDEAVYPAASWLINHTLDYDTTLAQDTNGDGVDLLMAYALNLDPTLDLSDSLPKAVISSNAMSMTYYAASPGITYILETSEDLETWTDTGITLSGLDGNNEVNASIDTTAPHRFLRLRVEK